MCQWAQSPRDWDSKVLFPIVGYDIEVFLQETRKLNIFDNP